LKFEIGETVQVTLGDSRGRIGIVRRLPTEVLGRGNAYAVEFVGDGGVSSFREGNLELAPAGSSLPEFMLAENLVHLLGEEPYELITGGLMGKRRRYKASSEMGLPPFGMADGADGACDFRRFPVEHRGSVVAGLWSRFLPEARHFDEVVALMGLTPSR
jgi:hypothetical protein